MTDRHGFALVAVLWLVAALSVLMTVGMQSSSMAARAMENRLSGARAAWAARACLALIQARYADGDRRVAVLDSVALGPGTWCEADRFDWDVLVNPNVGDSVGLLQVLGDSVRVASILDWIDGDDVPRAFGAESEWYLARGRKPPRNAALAHARELGLIRGFEHVDAATLEALFTARGDGRVSANRASAIALRSISVLTPEDAERLMEFRVARRPFRDAEDVDLALGLELDVDGFRELTNRLSFAGPGRTMRVVGRSRGARAPITAELIATLVPVNERLAVVGLEVW